MPVALHASLAAQKGQGDKNLILEAVPAQASLGCSLPHPQQSARAAACAVRVTAQRLTPATAFLSPCTSPPHSRATRVAVTDRVRRSLQRRAEPSAGEPQPPVPRWEEQGHLLEAQRGCQKQGRMEREERMAAWGDDKRQEHRLQKEEQSTTWLQRRGRKGDR